MNATSNHRPQTHKCYTLLFVNDVISTSLNEMVLGNNPDMLDADYLFGSFEKHVTGMCEQLFWQMAYVITCNLHLPTSPWENPSTPEGVVGVKELKEGAATLIPTLFI